MAGARQRGKSPGSLLRRRTHFCRSTAVHMEDRSAGVMATRADVHDIKLHYVSSLAWCANNTLIVHASKLACLSVIQANTPVVLRSGVHMTFSFKPTINFNDSIQNVYNFFE